MRPVIMSTDDPPQDTISELNMRLFYARGDGERELEYELVIQLADAYEQVGQLDKAVIFREQALNLARALNDRPGEMRALGKLSNALVILGHYDAALAHMHAALALARALSGPDSAGLVFAYEEAARAIGRLAGAS